VKNLKKFKNPKIVLNVIAVVVLLVLFYYQALKHSEDIGTTAQIICNSTNIDPNNLSVILYDLDRDKTLYSMNADKLMSIGSINKLFVAATALNYFGEDYRFKTVVAMNRDLYIKGYGDPSFTSQDMEKLVNGLVDKGIREIKTNIILDATMFPVEKTAKNDRSVMDYNAKVSPLSVDYNCVDVVTYEGIPHPTVAIEPPVDYIKLIDKTTKTPDRTNFVINRFGDAIGIYYNITTTPPSFVRRSKTTVDDPVKHYGEVLKLYLKLKNIKFTGKIRTGKMPANSRILFEMSSSPLKVMITKMLKESKTFVAEQLVRLMQKNGLGEVRKFLVQKAGLDSSLIDIVDGAGISSRATPQAIIDFLKYVHNNFDHKAVMVESLSIGGVDGTLKDIVKDKKLVGKVKAKTGTLLHRERGLAGYLYSGNKTYSFVILVNDKNSYRLKGDWEDKMLRSFLNKI